ncbi:hypothetical protein E1180_14775 [Roseibium denhamense]|uniref:Uncharacterized protein n=1 Tax=Roseibium denhamense TaxID=76305 RepID=A0ABY1NJC0_9HYPH|nr:hypothetical protein [Roseibium denhamense]MTI06777.1 hypothetical protein [Roseibium denhamense]SMP11195.1 hypothetical protein SAMN06265374_1304 [Roseibium denhamense]
MITEGRELETLAATVLLDCEYQYIDEIKTRESRSVKTPDFANFFERCFVEIKHIEKDPTNKIYDRLHNLSKKQGKFVVALGKVPSRDIVDTMADPVAGLKEVYRTVSQVYESHISKANSQFRDHCKAFKVESFLRVLVFTHSGRYNDFKFVTETASRFFMSEFRKGRFQCIDVVLFFGVDQQSGACTGYLPVRDLTAEEDGAVEKFSQRLFFQMQRSLGAA